MTVLRRLEYNSLFSVILADRRFHDGSVLPMLIQSGNLSRNEAVIRRRSDDGNSLIE